MQSTVRQTARVGIRGLGIVTAATLMASAGNYFLSVSAAHNLSASDFGAFGATLGMLAILSTIGLAAQAMIARDSARGGRDSNHWSTAWKVGSASLVLVAILAPITSRLLAIPVFPLFIMLLTIPFSVASASLLGHFQGTEQHSRLAIGILGLGLWRAALGTLLLVKFGSLLGLSIGLLVGSLLSFLTILTMIYREKSPSTSFGRESLGEFAMILQVLALMFLLTNMDVVFARLLLPADLSGVYAVGSLVTKITFFLPGPILIVLYPKMTGSGRLRALAFAELLTVGLGAVSIIVCMVFPARVIQIVAGQRFDQLEGNLWIFAVAGTALAVLQVAVYGGLARKDKRTIFLMWGGLVLSGVMLLVFGSNGVVAIIAIVGVTAMTLAILANALEMLGHGLSRQSVPN